MIVDFVQSRYEGLYLYERTRGPDGVLKENYIYADDSDFVKPFFWIRQNAPSFVAVVNKTGFFSMTSLRSAGIQVDGKGGGPKGPQTPGC